MSSAKKLDQLPEQTKNGVHLHRTRNSQNAKGVAVALLQARLVDAIDMSLITKQAHWNLKGPQFIGVHLMLDTFRTEQDEAGDPDTADIFTEVSRGIDKQLWFLEAHTQEQSPSASFPTK
jgi:DNA-binding ferritin-like protein